MVISPRGGQKRTITATLDVIAGLTVICEKCGSTWGAA